MDFRFLRQFKGICVYMYLCACITVFVCVYLLVLVTCSVEVLTSIRGECVDLARCVPPIPTQSATLNLEHNLLNPDFIETHLGKYRGKCCFLGNCRARNDDKLKGGETMWGL